MIHREIMGEITEWRVTGQPGEGYPEYDFTWSPLLGNTHGGSAETLARQFMTMNSIRQWEDGPHLWSRKIVFSGWVPDAT